MRLLYPAAISCTLALGLWLFWPSLELGLFADDYVATAMLDGRFASARGPFDLFDFANGTARDLASLERLGSIAWWAPSDFRISFLRPLSSALWHVDRALFGDAVVAYHVHSLAAWALLVVVASTLFRRLFSAPIAALATLLFAIDESHHFAVIWLSNRGGIYAVAVGLLALLAHLRWRVDGRARYALVSAALFSVGLLFGEWVVPVLAYLVAFEIMRTQERWQTRARALLPSILPTLGFLVGRALLGYGARGSGAYVDPGAEPLRFLLSLAQRIPVFVADMVWNIPSSWWDQGTPWRDRILTLSLFSPRVWLRMPSWPFFHLVLGALGFLALGIGLRFCWRDLARAERDALRWLLPGSLLSLVPVVGSFPSTRLTLAAIFGLSPLFALVLRQIGRRLLSAPRIALPRWLALYGVGAAVLYFQLFEPLADNIQAEVDSFSTTIPWVLAAELSPARVAHQRVFLLAGGEFTSTFYFAYIWSHHGRPLPRSYYPISTAPYAQDIERVSDNMLRLRALGGPYLGSGHESMFSSSRRRWRDGEAVPLEGLRITAEQTNDGLPQSLLLTFERSVDDPDQVFLLATPRGLARFAPPAVGQTRRIPRASYPSWLTLDRARDQRRIAPLPSMLTFASPPTFVEYEPP